jgi:hypothetical protein
MKQDEIPSAEEFLRNKPIAYVTNGLFEQSIEAMQEFAKLHVQAALKAASEKAELGEYNKGDHQVCFMADDMGDAWILDKQSILSAYPLDLIK